MLPNNPKFPIRNSDAFLINAFLTHFLRKLFSVFNSGNRHEFLKILCHKTELAFFKNKILSCVYCTLQILT